MAVVTLPVAARPSDALHWRESLFLLSASRLALCIAALKPADSHDHAAPEAGSHLRSCSLLLLQSSIISLL